MSEVIGRFESWALICNTSIFVLDYDFELSPTVISFAKLLLLSKTEWGTVREKYKPPKPKLESALYDLLISTVENRIAEYPTTLEVVNTSLVLHPLSKIEGCCLQADRALLLNGLSLNKRRALVVRIGEKEVLHGHLGRLNALKEADSKRSSSGSNKRRYAQGESSTKLKKTRR